jgi:putative pyruvate formate lyase activating enzyme
VKFKVARIAKHIWEEPVISGKNGSGTVFFSGCNLGCVYCQNFEISHAPFKGEYYDETELLDKIIELSKSGVHNINFVTPSHYIKALPSFLRALKQKIDIPIVYNTSAYEKVDDLRGLAGLVDIYLPGFKYADDELAKNYSGVGDYVETARAAIAEMRRQQPADIFENGTMKRGVIVRHLILPSHTDDTCRVLDEIAKIDKTMYVSLMSQFFPTKNCPKEIARRITAREYNLCKEYFFNIGLTNGFQQSPKSAIQGYTPKF